MTIQTWNKWLHWGGLLGLALVMTGCTTRAEYVRMQRALGAEIIELRQGKDKNKELLKSQEKDLFRLQDAMKTEKARYGELKAKFDIETGKVKKLEMTVKELQAKAGGNAQQIDKFKEQLKGGRKKLFELQTELNRKEEELKQKETALNTKLAELEKTKKTSAELSATLAKKEAMLNQQTKSLKEKESKLASALARARKLESRVEKLRKVFTDLKTRLKSLVQAGKLNVQMIDGMLVVQLPNKILFASGSSSLKSEGRKTIAGVADILKTMSYRWQVSGHTDNVGKDWSNWRLSTRRALAVLRILLKAGMPSKQLSVAGFGQHQPSAANDTRENRALNRRTELVLIPNLSEIFGSVVKAN